MSLHPPSLDDISASELVAMAQKRLRDLGYEWEAQDRSDPGLALIEAFAQITSAELARLNSLPKILQAQFLSMLGGQLAPAQVEAAELVFSVDLASQVERTIPKGLRVASDHDPNTIYTLVDSLVLARGSTEVTGLAVRANQVERQRVGTGTGAPAQRIILPHDQLVGAPDPAARIEVLVACDTRMPRNDLPIVQHQGQGFLRYLEARSTPDGRQPEFYPDRAAGHIRFASDGAFVPPKGAAVYASYFYLDDASADSGPCPPGSLKTPIDPLPGMRVSNRSTSRPGRATETIDARLSRGPLAIFSSDLAMRARDYEALALSAHPGVARALATTPSERWAFADPGLVQVFILPHVAPDETGAVTADAVAAACAANVDVKDKVLQRLTRAAPLGVVVRVDWMRTRSVSIGCTIYASPGTERDPLELEAKRALGRLLTPMPPAPTGPDSSEWPFGWPCGRAVRVSEIIEKLNAVPGVRAVDRVELRPGFPMGGPVAGLTADCGQAGVWFAIIGGELYRTVNRGAGWTRTSFGPNTGSDHSAALAVATHPNRTGLLAVSMADGLILASEDCGQSFYRFGHLADPAHGLAWADGSESPRLLAIGPGDMIETVAQTHSDTHLEDITTLPTQRGLVTRDGTTVGPAYDIATCPDGRGNRFVALALRDLNGVLLSDDSGWDGSLLASGLAGHDVRALCFVRQDGRLWLLAGCTQPFVAKQASLYCSEITGIPASAGLWVPAQDGWPGGSIFSLCVSGATVYAATAANGLVTGAFEHGAITWQRPATEAGLPAGAGAVKPAAMARVAAASWGADEAKTSDIMLAGEGHLLASTDNGVSFQEVSVRNGVERIGIPEFWTVCTQAHRIEVKYVGR